MALPVFWTHIVPCSSQPSEDMPFPVTLHFTRRWSRGCLRVALLILDVMFQLTGSWPKINALQCCTDQRKSTVCSVFPSGLVCDNFYPLGILALFCIAVLNSLKHICHIKSLQLKSRFTKMKYTKYCYDIQRILPDCVLAHFCSGFSSSAAYFIKTLWAW